MLPQTTIKQTSTAFQNKRIILMFKFFLYFIPNSELCIGDKKLKFTFMNSITNSQEGCLDILLQNEKRSPPPQIILSYKQHYLLCWHAL